MSAGLGVRQSRPIHETASVGWVQHPARSVRTIAPEDAVSTILNEPTFRVLDISPEFVEHAIEQFRRYDDQAISLTDHVIAVQADERGIDHLFTYDGDFRTFGITVVPHSA